MTKKKTNRTLRTLGIVLWLSFLCSCGATTVFFSMFDPETLGHVTTWPVALSRIGGYSIGFFLFWLLTAITSGLTAFLLSIPSEKLDKDTFSNHDIELENDEKWRE